MEQLDLDITVRTVEHGIAVVELAGLSEPLEAFALREQLIDLVRAGKHHLVLDLKGLEFLDPTTLGVLIGACKRARIQDGSVCLVAARQPAQRAFRITGMEKFFHQCPNVDHAVGHIHDQLHDGGDPHESPSGPR